MSDPVSWRKVVNDFIASRFAAGTRGASAVA